MRNPLRVRSGDFPGRKLEPLKSERAMVITVCDGDYNADLAAAIMTPGFQAFNINPATKSSHQRQFVPATLFLAADHLQVCPEISHLLAHRSLISLSDPSPSHTPGAYAPLGRCVSYLYKFYYA